VRRMVPSPSGGGGVATGAGPNRARSGLGQCERRASAAIGVRHSVRCPCQECAPGRQECAGPDQECALRRKERAGRREGCVTPREERAGRREERAGRCEERAGRREECATRRQECATRRQECSASRQECAPSRQGCATRRQECAPSRQGCAVSRQDCAVRRQGCAVRCQSGTARRQGVRTRRQKSRKSGQCPEKWTGEEGDSATTEAPQEQRSCDSARGSGDWAIREARNDSVGGGRPAPTGHPEGAKPHLSSRGSEATEGSLQAEADPLSAASRQLPARRLVPSSVPPHLEPTP